MNLTTRSSRLASSSARLALSTAPSSFRLESMPCLSLDANFWNGFMPRLLSKGGSSLRRHPQTTILRFGNSENAVSVGGISGAYPRLSGGRSARPAFGCELNSWGVSRRAHVRPQTVRPRLREEWRIQRIRPDLWRIEKADICQLENTFMTALLCDESCYRHLTRTGPNVCYADYD